MSIPLPPPLPPPSDQSQQRHGCLLAWLILMLVANTATAILTPLSLVSMRQAGVQPSMPITGVIVVCALANVIFTAALLRWKKWGFYGFLATAGVSLVVNLSLGIGILHCLVGLAGVAILYGVLNIGGERKAWPRLRW